MSEREINVKLSNVKILDKEEFFSITQETREKLCRNQFEINVISGGIKTSRNTLIDWCNENCKSLVYVNQDHNIFYFEDETDASGFKLRWS